MRKGKEPGGEVSEESRDEPLREEKVGSSAEMSPRRHREREAMTPGFGRQRQSSTRMVLWGAETEG